MLFFIACVCLYRRKEKVKSFAYKKTTTFSCILNEDILIMRHSNHLNYLFYFFSFFLFRFWNKIKKKKQRNM